ncbi:SAM-dependent methyltransferase [Streptomonospora nanhaiensis]|uniref:O-methyltransferase involved in polyketide biosynthesis n=1 Tax=Streptomonospora nanhaiensis TaxID=1323731 RepID=A0A853BV01_9ACTN|nr:SAM-dependent methyltransferase [Streptomonospora nanhaiensis]MBX9390281.1 SAM-dependent methyltransferase [Streptomonospora nanhaiensis]NYI99118.1 O-methyltransferase involved in polyketide biosynthesis [Streptomonospora nanhaiensis]
MSTPFPPADESREAPPSLDLSVPHSARVWNYWLGGKDNYAADRAAGDDVLRRLPDIADGARAERAFLIRVIHHLVREAGIRQFLDIGTGLPTMNNTHEVAQELAPESRVVYVDNDPLVMVHARALLTSSPEGATNYIEADLREPEAILEAARATLDFSRPVGLMLLGVVNHLVDTERSYAVVARLVEELAPGSHLVLTHSTAEIHGEPMLEVMREMNERGGTPIIARSRKEIEGYFAGTELLEPGVVSCSRWRPEPTAVGAPPEVYLFGGVGRVV